jgi:hypothetical protein
VQRMPLQQRPGSNAQCSKICDGNSTKSRSTWVPERPVVGHLRADPCKP